MAHQFPTPSTVTGQEGDDDQYKTLFFDQVGFNDFGDYGGQEFEEKVKEHLKNEELKACQATGFQARFMIFLQSMLTLLFGSHIVYASLTHGCLNDEKIGTVLREVQACSRLPSRSTSDNVNAKNQQKYTDLLKQLRNLEKTFGNLQSDPKPSQVCSHWRALYHCLQFIKARLETMKTHPKEEPPQQIMDYCEGHFLSMVNKPGWVDRTISSLHSLMFHSTSEDLRTTLEVFEKENSEKNLKNRKYNLNKLRRLIPRLQIMAVGEIIASFNLPMADLQDAIAKCQLFGKQDQLDPCEFHESFAKHEKSLRHFRNRCNHNLLMREDGTKEIVDMARCVVNEFLRPLLLGPSTATNSTPDWFSESLLGSYDEFRIMQEENQSGEEVTRLKREIYELRKQLADVTKPNKELKTEHEGSPLERHSISESKEDEDVNFSPSKTPTMATDGLDDVEVQEVEGGGGIGSSKPEVKGSEGIGSSKPKMKYSEVMGSSKPKVKGSEAISSKFDKSANEGGKSKKKKGKPNRMKAVPKEWLNFK